MNLRKGLLLLLCELVDLFLVLLGLEPLHEEIEVGSCLRHFLKLIHGHVFDDLLFLISGLLLDIVYGGLGLGPDLFNFLMIFFVVLLFTCVIQVDKQRWNASLGPQLRAEVLRKGVVDNSRV